LYGGVMVAGAGTPTPGVPEPATWVMMALGFGAVGYALRRSRGWRPREAVPAGGLVI
jgi:hypothetical protein